MEHDLTLLVSVVLLAMLTATGNLSWCWNITGPIPKHQKAKIFGIYSLLQGCTSPVCAPCDNSKSPQQNPAPEDDKPDEESNENEEMTAAPVDASTPISNGVSERKRRRNNCARAAAKRRRSSQFDKENRVPTGDQNDSAEEEFVEKHVSDICQVKLNNEKESAKLCGYSTPRWGTTTKENPSSNDSWAFQAVTPERSWEEDQQQTRDENTVKVPTETDYTVIVDRSELKTPR
eukprot:XP_027308472.1 uncharacterized protein LOC113842916 isoform X3 [Anas platyrhynchos]